MTGSWLDTYAGWALIGPSLAVLVIWGAYVLALGLGRSASKQPPMPPPALRPRCYCCGSDRHLSVSEVFRQTLCVDCHDDLVELAPYERDLR